MLKDKQHGKELKLILQNLNKLSIAEVEFVLHFGIFGRSIKVIKSINRTKECFEVVSFNDDDIDFYAGEERLKG